jgi:hypothetical protein
MGCTIGVLGFNSRQGLGIFLFITASKPVLGPTQLPIQWVSRALYLGVKRPGREANYLTSVLSRGAITSLPQYVFMAWCLVKHRDNFTFYLYLLQLIHISWLFNPHNPQYLISTNRSENKECDQKAWD